MILSQTAHETLGTLVSIDMEAVIFKEVSGRQRYQGNLRKFTVWGVLQVLLAFLMWAVELPGSLPSQRNSVLLLWQIWQLSISNVKYLTVQMKAYYWRQYDSYSFHFLNTSIGDRKKVSILAHLKTFLLNLQGHCIKVNLGIKAHRQYTGGGYPGEIGWCAGPTAWIRRIESTVSDVLYMYIC